MSWDLLDESFENATNFDVAGWSTEVGNGNVDPNSTSHTFTGHGTQCLALNSTGSNYTAAINRAFSNATVVYGEIHINIASESFTDGNQTELLLSYANDYTYCPYIYLDQVSGGLLFKCIVRFDGSDKFSQFAGVTVDTDYTIRWKYDNTAKTFQWLVNNNSVAANTFTTGTTGLRWLYLGPQTGGSQNNCIIYMDGVQLSSTNWVDAGGGFNANNYVRLRWTK